MIAADQIKVELSQLKIGLALKYDLVAPNGNLLAKAGYVVSANLKNRWRAEGYLFAIANVAEPKPVIAESIEPSPFTQPYDPVVLQRLESSFKQASDYVLRSAIKLIDGDFSGAIEVRSLFERLQSDIASDVATVLAAFAQSPNSDLSEDDELIAQRSSQLSILGLILAHQLNFSPEDQQSTALAGMFHDISLLDCVRSSCSKFYNSGYNNHGIDSAWMLDSVVGINAKVGLAVAQLHEQVDGTGFPKRLPATRICPIARILNVADAYLTLTNDTQPSMFPQACNFHPADALGYLMYHAALGRFDRRVVRALIDATSLYPVGCRVKLSDNSTAVVLRSTSDSPSKPIVRVESGHESIIDLRKSNLSILQPTMSPLDLCTRIRKSNLAEVYWR